MDLATRERDKYRRMWAEPSYHIGSPGDRAVPAFLASGLTQRGDTIVDIGCGSGRAAVKLQEAGLHVTLLDFCRTAVEPSAAHLPYLDACLWELPDLSFQWFYCVDVLEHIPPEKVDAVLDGLARCSTRGGYLQICCVDDTCGEVIGETLHLTVKPPAWWREQVVPRWTTVRDVSTGVYAIFYLGGPHGR